MIGKLLRAARRMLRSKKTPTPVTDEMVQREITLAKNDLATKQGALETHLIWTTGPSAQVQIRGSRSDFTVELLRSALGRPVATTAS